MAGLLGSPMDSAYILIPSMADVTVFDTTARWDVEEAISPSLRSM